MNPDSCKKCGCRCVQVCAWRDYYYCCCWDCFFEGPRGATSDEAVKLWGVKDPDTFWKDNPHLVKYK